MFGHQFEAYRNSTDVYRNLKVWNDGIRKSFNSDKNLQQIFKAGYFQYQTLKYMAGCDLPTTPRGILLYHQMGSGKTMESLSTALYVITTVKGYQYQGPKVVFILNKILYKKTLDDLQKYVNILNRVKYGLNLLPSRKPVDYQSVLQEFEFIIMNDPVNFTDNFNAINDITNLNPRFIIFDEAHNLFRNINNLNQKGINIYEQLMSMQNIQLLFLTGSAISNNIREIALCFQMLSGNSQLFQTIIEQIPSLKINEKFEEFFVTETLDKPLIKYKDIFIKRIAGLVSSYEQDPQTIKPGGMPQKRDLIVKQVKIIDSQQLARYTFEKSEEQGRGHHKFGKDRFMQRSRIALNLVDTDGRSIHSAKFKALKEHIEANTKTVHIVFSNFVESGIIAFTNYCKENTKDFTWNEFNSNTQQSEKKPENVINFMLIHGNVEQSEREKLLSFVNKQENVYGRNVNVILLSPAANEGINIFNVQYVHILEPQWSKTIEQQVIYRAVRVGSHNAFTNLEDRFVQPIIYVGYVDEEYDMSDNRHIKQIQNKLSTDQYIYWQSSTKSCLIEEFCILLKLGSINCGDLQKVVVSQLQHRMSSKQQQNPCFKCKANNKKLFDPKSMYQDVQNHNCYFDYKPSQMISKIISFNNIDYSWFFDIYSYTGIRIYELRDGSYLNDSTELFQQLQVMVNEKVINLQNNVDDGSQHLDRVPKAEEESKVVDQGKEVQVQFIDNINDIPKAYHKLLFDMSKGYTFSKLHPSKLIVNVIPLDKSIGELPLHQALEVLKFEDTIENVVKKATEAVQAYALKSKVTKKFVFNSYDAQMLYKGTIYSSNRIFDEVVYKMYSEGVDSACPQIAQMLINKRNEIHHIIIMRKEVPHNLDQQLLAQKLKQILN